MVGVGGRGGIGGCGDCGEVGCDGGSGGLLGCVTPWSRGKARANMGHPHWGDEPSAGCIDMNRYSLLASGSSFNRVAGLDISGVRLS